MVRRLVVAPVALALAASHPAASFTQTGGPELDAGIAHVRAGEYALGVVTLDGVVRRWLERDGDAEALARVHLYLSVAYLGLELERTAKAHLVEALKLEPDAGYEAGEFPPEAERFIEETRAEYDASRREVLKEPEGSSGGSKVPVILGLTALGGLVAAVASAGGDAPDPTPNPTPPPLPKLSDLSASVSSPANGTNLNCTESVPITVTLTNTSQGRVAVTGIRRSATTVLQGGCSGAGGFTFSPQVAAAGPGTTVVLQRGNIFAGISTTGCCYPESECDGRSFCVLEYTFTVITSAGEVNAGGIGYGLSFAGCPVCSSTAAGQDVCRGPAVD